MSEDKALALQVLQEGASCVAVRDGYVIGSRQGSGLRPLYDLIETFGFELKGAFIADRVIGRAAALFLVNIGIAACHGRLVSEGAVRILTEAQIPVSWDERAPYILARDPRPPQELCPMERLVESAPTEQDALKRLENVLSGRTPLHKYIAL